MTAVDGVTYVLLIRLIVHFIHILQEILELEGGWAGVVLWLDELVISLHQDDIDRLKALSNDVPEAAQEENWNTIKPELGLPPMIVPPSLGDSLGTTGNTSVSLIADSIPSTSSQEDKLYVLVLGPTGSCKTSFIHNYLHLNIKGEDPSHTKSVTEYDTEFKGRAVSLVDTPGFGTTMDNLNAFLQLSHWLYDLGAASVSLAVLIFLRRGVSSDHRLLESISKIYKGILGADSYRHITFVTVAEGVTGTPARGVVLEYGSNDDEMMAEYRTMWTDLTGDAYPSWIYRMLWEEFIEHGARAAQWDYDAQSAYNLLDTISKASTRTPNGGIQLQRELYSSQMSLTETRAGSEVLSAIRRSCLFWDRELAENEYKRLDARNEMALSRSERRAILTQQLQLRKKMEQDFLAYDIRRRSDPEGSTSPHSEAAGLKAARPPSPSPEPPRQSKTGSPVHGYMMPQSSTQRVYSQPPPPPPPPSSVQQGKQPARRPSPSGPDSSDS